MRGSGRFAFDLGVLLLALTAIALLSIGRRSAEAEEAERRVTAARAVARADRDAAWRRQALAAVDAVGDRRRAAAAAERAALGLAWPEEVAKERERAAARDARELARRALVAPPSAPEAAPGTDAVGPDPWILAGTALLLGGLFALREWRYGRPAARLAAVAERILDGEDRRAPPIGAPPLRRLAGAFNRAFDSLAAGRRELERRVDEKTRALADALEESRALNARLRQVLEELEGAQSRLAQQEKMAAVGLLARGVAHEFHNLLGGIGGCTEELLEDARDADSRETLQVIHRATRRGKAVVERLRGLAREDGGPIEDVALAPLLDDVARLLAREAQDRGVRVEVAADAALRVRARSALVAQVVMNLLLNAIQASPPGGCVRLLAESRPRGVDLLVCDQGPGVPREERERIFEPFFTTRSSEGGTGLGLAISRDLAERLGATLAVGEGADGGAEFRLGLPAEETVDEG